MNAGRILLRALVVLGGAVAACAIAWLTATASASTVTEVADGPIASAAAGVVPSAGEVPLVRQARDTAVDRVRVLSGAAAHTARLATRVVASVPATVVEVGRTAVAALVPPVAGPREHVEKSAGPVVAVADDVTSAPAPGGQRERSTFRSPAIPVRAAAVSRSHADDRSEPGARGNSGQSWPPSCVGPASAGFTAGHDRNCGDAIQEAAAVHPRPSHRRNGVRSRAVAAAEIQPGVTPD
ncbi:hypothetical protein SAMN05421837_104728 [Amycolatopsis pretoriensis]|uniref:Uncharacterized protein n=1 Tax=Amycolatopsis pretoriensis TaxID=218821 RepID=A0A1H5QTN5_9PSEU|nr:hypothetical protein [Amycolatopsis pretoriensis]SEF29506.1 hypothetical protein SAMN05421837_104728 [Amycolatopsis pretoriensis]